MAITCVSTITVIDVNAKIVRIEADITVDAEPTDHVVMQNVDISTGPKKAEAANILWNKFLKIRNERLLIEGIQAEIDTLQASLNLDIEGRALP